MRMDATSSAHGFDLFFVIVFCFKIMPSSKRFSGYGLLNIVIYFNVVILPMDADVSLYAISYISTLLISVILFKINTISD
jgi:Zn-dependent membrane protease YugP